VVDDLNDLLGKNLLVGLTYLRSDGGIARKSQVCGRVVSVDPLVAIDRGDGSEPFTLPNEPQAFDLAEKGSYRLRDSGEIVDDPTTSRPGPSPRQEYKGVRLRRYGAPSTSPNTDGG
jgi:hypothetical protein